jgi:signal-transduction protein with cAMP-binding, CBS, and nucleotidyltransferase domain
MKVSDILRVKGNTLFTVTPDEPLAPPSTTMAEKDIGSLVVMEHGDLVGMLTFREVIQCHRQQHGAGRHDRSCARRWTTIRSPARWKPSSTKCAA